MESMLGSSNGTNSERSRFLDLSSIAIALQLALQMIVGVVLMPSYRASAEGAHASVAEMHRSSLRLLQAGHYWGSALLLLTGLLHLGALIWTGSYRRPFRAQFFGGLLAVGAAYGFQLTGNVLPFDRHGVQTASVEASIAARAPGVGSALSHAALGGSGFSPATLDLWYSLHRFGLPILGVAAVALCLAGRARLWRSWAIAIPLLPFVIGAIVPSPLGSAASSADFDMQAARVSWYVWPLHGTMRLFDSIGGAGWVGAMLLPGLFAAFLLLALAIGDCMKAWIARGVLLAFMFVMLVGTLGYGGGFAPLTGTRDPSTPTTVAPPTTQASAIDKILAERGRQRFNALECADCHGKDGLEAKGGPSLKNVWKRHSDADYYQRYIVSPTSVQPDSTMPAFPKTSPDDLKAIAEYLRSPK